MNIFGWKSKTIFSLVILFCGGLLGFALILQYFVFLVPCPLCILQRFVYLLIGLVAFFATFSLVKGISTQTYGLVILILALLGGGIAGRQVWLQQNPSLVDPTKCLIPMGSFFNSVILSLGGVGSCSSRDWTLFGLSIADWSLLCFAFLLLVGLYLTLYPKFKDENAEGVSERG